MRTLEVVAEAAQGYGGSAEKQVFLLRAAKAAGADSIKFQLVYADELATADYEHYQTFRGSEMPGAAWRELGNRAREEGISLYLDVFGARSLDTAVTAQADGIKLHSSDTLNVALIEAVAQAPVPRVVLSTGGGHGSEIREAVELLRAKSLVLMHGFQGYPTRNEDNQVARLRWLRAEFPEHDIGFADHVPFDDPKRLWLAAVAIGAGANVIEKHLTTALALREIDYHAAVAPDEFAAFVENMRTAMQAFAPADAWDDDFGMSESELGYRKGLKKQVVASRDLRDGHVLSVEDIVLKRTSVTEDVVYDTREVLGRSLMAAVAADEPITRRALG